MSEAVRRLIDAGYPFRIIGNDEHEAVLYDIQPLCGGEFCAIYMYPGGQVCHSLSEVKRFMEVKASD